MIGDHVPYVRHAKALGFDVTLFQSPLRISLVDASMCSSVHVFDFKNINIAKELAKTIHRFFPFDAIWTFTEEAVELTSLVAEELGFPNIPYNTVQLAQNKGLFRKALNDQGISSVAFIQTNELSDVKKFALQVGYPIVCKPVDGAASKDVFIVENEKELEEVFTKKIKQPLSSFIIEEFLDGPEVSVEFVTFNGVHYPLVITDKLITPKRCVEVGHTIPAKCSNDPMFREEIYGLVIQMLDLIGHRFGPSHTEIKLTSKGPKIIEVNIRPGGDFIPYMIDKALDYDMFSETLKYLVKEQYSIPLLKEGAAAVRYFQFPPGVVEEISGIDEVKQDPDLLWLEFNLKKGDIIQEMVNSYTRSGCVVVKGETAEIAALNAKRLMDKIKIVIKSS